jgi:hypothetical protein
MYRPFVTNHERLDGKVRRKWKGSAVLLPRTDHANGGCVDDWKATSSGGSWPPTVGAIRRKPADAEPKIINIDCV